MKVKSHLDFGRKAQIIQITLQKVSSLPSPGWAGGVVFLTTDNKVYFHNGSEWIPINDTSGLISSITGGAGISIIESGSERKVVFDPDNSTLDTEPGDQGKAKIKDKGVKTKHIDDQAVDHEKLSADAVQTINILNNNVTFSKIQKMPTMTVIGHLGSGTETPGGVTVITSLEGIIAANNSLATAKAVKDYVDGIVGGIGSLIDGWDADTNNDFPSGANKGDYWYITSAGTIHDIEFVEGDVIIARSDNASTTDPADWIPLKTKRGQATTSQPGIVKLSTQAQARAMTDTEKVITPSNLSDVKATNEDAQGSTNDRFVTPQGLHNRTATTVRRGIAELATQAEVDSGTDTERIVTPSTLRTLLNTLFSEFGKHVQNIGNGSATSFTINHNLGTKDVQTEVFCNDTGESVITDVVRTTNQDVIVSFAEAPDVNAYRIVIVK